MDPMTMGVAGERRAAGDEVRVATCNTVSKIVEEVH
jgi:hypothetical protein